MLHIHHQGSTRIVETALYRDGDPSHLIKGHIAIEHQLRLVGQRCPSGQCGSRGQRRLRGRSIGQPHPDRDTDACRVGRVHLHIDRIYRTRHTANFRLSVEDLRIRLAPGGKHVERGRLLGIARSDWDDSLEIRILNTTAVVICLVRQNGIRGEAAALRERDSIVWVMVEIIVAHTRRRNGICATVSSHIIQRLRSHRVGRHIQHPVNGVIALIHPHIVISGFGIDGIIV